jgi:hypothetical protein
METEHQQPQIAINKIEVKLPAFSVEDPEVFFALAEVSFQAAGVTGDLTKFLHVVAALDSDTRQKVRDVLLNLPAADKYATLKNALVNRLVASQAQKTRQLLEMEAPGDRKPTEYLRHLKSLAGNSANDPILKSLWMSRLPHQTQAILASQPNAELDQLAILADAIDDTTPSYASVSGINEAPKDSELRAKVEELSRKFDEVLDLLKSERQSPARAGRRPYSPGAHGQTAGRRRSTTPRPSSRQGYGKKPNGLCFYHAKHGERAYRCVQPCTYPGNEPQRE